MTTPAPWLERLARATEYRELQLAFTEIATQATHTSDPAGLAAQIDEAILRIERERHHDEDELQAFEREHASFKEKQSGVVGWLKRHVPFTETRRQEKEHQQAIDDQQAEVLADNLVIARAQMLKEGLLPPETRRLGLTPAAWRERLETHDAAHALRDYGAALTDLAREAAQGQAFVEAIDADLDAFARAKFAAKEDRDRRDEDLKAARAELAVLRRELDDERALRTRSLARLGELVTADLSSRDRDFERLTDRVTRLTAEVEGSEKLEANLTTLGAELESARDLAEKLESLPAEREAKEQEAASLAYRVDDAERTRLRASSHATEQEARARQAKKKLEAARSALAAAKRAFDAHVAASGQVEMPSGADFASSSPEAGALASAEKASAEAEGDHRAAKAVHDQAESEHRSAERAVKELREKIERLRRESASLDEDGDRIRRELAEAVERAEGAYEATDLEDRLLPRRRFRVEGFGDRHPSLADLRDAQERMAKRKEAAAKEREALAADAAAERKRRDERLQARCRELFGPELAAEVCP